jgi:ABC-type proline/glycine betaine transport system ATPase subunit
VLLDEPFGALDPVTRHALQGEFRALQQRLRRTALFVTHDLREAIRIGDRIAVVAEGRVLRTALRPVDVASSDDDVVRALARGERAVTDEVLLATSEHVVLVLASVGSRRRSACRSASRSRAGRPGSGSSSAPANVVQTIPSLALFGLLIPLPLFGIGTRRRSWR